GALRGGVVAQESRRVPHRRRSRRRPGPAARPGDHRGRRGAAARGARDAPAHRAGAVRDDPGPGVRRSDHRVSGLALDVLLAGPSVRRRGGARMVAGAERATERELPARRRRVRTAAACAGDAGPRPLEPPAGRCAGGEHRSGRSHRVGSTRDRPPALHLGSRRGVLLVGFVAHALRGRATPLLDLRLFARRSFAVAAALLFVTGLAMWAPLFLLPLFYQRVLGADALDAGLLLAPPALGTALGMAAAGRLADRAAAARPLIVAGTAFAVVATLPFALAPRGVAGAALGAALLARGFGLGVAHVPLMPLLYGGVERESIGQATGL